MKLSKLKFSTHITREPALSTEAFLTVPNHLKFLSCTLLLNFTV